MLELLKDDINPVVGRIVSILWKAAGASIGVDAIGSWLSLMEL
jgi:hypothetical protein